jgi:hypothetical protein
VAGTSTLSDDFSGASLNTTRWPIAYGTSVTLTGGRLRISCDTTYAGVQSDDVYTLDSFSAEPFPPALASAPADCYGTVMAQSTAQPAGTTVGFFIDRVAGILHCVVWSGYFDAGAASVTYNATNHAWLHFTYNGSTFVWQSSLTQTGTRTTLRTMSSSLPAWRNNADFSVYFDTHRDGGTSNFYEIGAINPSTAHPTTGTAAVAVTASATRSTTRTRTGSAALVPTATATRATVRTRTGSAAVATTATATRTTARTRSATGVAAVTATATCSTVRTSAGSAASAASATGTRTTVRAHTGTAGVATLATATYDATETHTTSGTGALALTATYSESTSRSTLGTAATAVTTGASRSTIRTIAATATVVVTGSAESDGGDEPMTQTLFTSQVPAVPDASDAASYSMGTYFTPAVDGTITHIRWYFPASAQPGGEAVKANLFRNSDSAKLGGADAVFASPGTPGAWNEVALTTPVEVVGGTLYCATIRTPGRYVASTGAGSVWPIVNGDLSTATNAGRFTSGASGNVDFPSTSFNNGTYFVDVVFSTGEAPEVHPTTGTATVVATATATVTPVRPTSGAAGAVLTASAARLSSRTSAAAAPLAAGAVAGVATVRTSSGTATVVVTAEADTGGSEEHTSSGTATVAVTTRATVAGTRVLARTAPLAVIGSGTYTSARHTAGSAPVAVTAGAVGTGAHPGPPLTTSVRSRRLTAVQRSSRVTSTTRPGRIR